MDDELMIGSLFFISLDEAMSLLGLILFELGMVVDSALEIFKFKLEIVTGTGDKDFPRSTEGIGLVLDIGGDGMITGVIAFVIAGDFASANDCT